MNLYNGTVPSVETAAYRYSRALWAAVIGAAVFAAVELWRTR